MGNGRRRTQPLATKAIDRADPGTLLDSPTWICEPRNAVFLSFAPTAALAGHYVSENPASSEKSCLRCVPPRTPLQAHYCKRRNPCPGYTPDWISPLFTAGTPLTNT